ITTNTAPGPCSRVVSYSAPTHSDNCPGETVVQTGGLSSGSAFPKGITTNCFTVTDASGNTNSCNFTVTVNDTEKPMIGCPGNITTNTAPGTCSQVVSYSAPTHSDNCPGETVAQTGGLSSGSTFPKGITTNCFTV